VTELNPHQKDAIGRAAYLRQDIQRFQRDWPTLNSIHDQLPPFTWAELERQLASLSPTPGATAMIHDLVSATRKQAPFKPTELVLREILCIASAVMDETFLASTDPEASSSSDSEEGPMR
jgi:hypothetical protein